MAGCEQGDLWKRGTTLEKISFRSRIDKRTRWADHQLPYESVTDTVTRLLKRLKTALEAGEYPLFIPLAKWGRNKPFAGRSLAFDITDPELVAFIKAKVIEFGDDQTHTLRKLLVQACNMEPERSPTPHEAIEHFKAGEVITPGQWVAQFNPAHAVSAACHGAAILREKGRVLLRFGPVEGVVNKDYLFLPRKYKSGRNAVVAIVKLPPDLKPSFIGKRKILSYVANGVSLPAFSTWEFLNFLFGKRDTSSLQIVLEQGGAVVIEYNSLPFCIMVKQGHLGTRAVDWAEVFHIDATEMTASEAREIFYGHFVDSFKSDDPPQAIGLTLKGVGDVALVRLDVFDFRLHLA